MGLYTILGIVTFLIIHSSRASPHVTREDDEARIPAKEANNLEENFENNDIMVNKDLSSSEMRNFWYLAVQDLPEKYRSMFEELKKQEESYKAVSEEEGQVHSRQKRVAVLVREAARAGRRVLSRSLRRGAQRRRMRGQRSRQRLSQTVRNGASGARQTLQNAVQRTRNAVQGLRSRVVG